MWELRGLVTPVKSGILDTAVNCVALGLLAGWRCYVQAQAKSIAPFLLTRLLTPGHQSTSSVVVLFNERDGFMDLIFIWVGVLLIAGIIISKLIRVSASKKSEEVAASLLKSRFIDDRLKTIFADYSIEPPESDTIEGRLAHKAFEFVQLIVRETIKRSNKDIRKLSNDELFSAMLIGFVASDYIAHLMQGTYTLVDNVGEHVSYENVSITTCGILGVQAQRQPEDVGRLIREVGGAINSMLDCPNESRLVQSISHQIAEFLSTGDKKHLRKLGSFYKALNQSAAKN